MLQLRREHMNAFSEVAQDNFEQRAIAHFREFFSAQTRDLTDEDLRVQLRAGTARAAQWDLISEQGVMQFVDTGLLFGEDFDCKPELVWAREILEDEEEPDRASKLLARAVTESNKEPL